jgi:mycothiol synthase
MSTVRPSDGDVAIRTEIGRLVRRVVRRVVHGARKEPAPPPEPSELQLVWPTHLSAMPPPYTVPGAYSLRTYEREDEAEFFALMDRAGFPGWNPQTSHPWSLKILPDGFFFVTENQSGRLAATAMACHNPAPLHPFGATLSCVAVDPAHRGKGLGHTVSAAATGRLLKAGYKDIYMETDDWRLPAIKIYLTMGWVPFLFQEDMPRRWKAVTEELGVPYAPESWRTLGA